MTSVDSPVVPQPAPEIGSLEKILRRDRTLVIVALFVITALSWLYIVDESRTPLLPGQSAGVGRPLLMACCGAKFGVTFVMWAVMMVGMMVPSAAQMILTFAAVSRSRQQRGGPYIPASIFLSGYLVAWTAYSALAAGAQWGLYKTGMLDPHRQIVAPWLAGIVLILTGIFQLTPAKNVCLTHCRSPMGYIMTDWRDGPMGAFLMGLKHGAFCVACCWLLMLLLFVAGVMNLFWCALITIYVVAEKMLPWRRAVTWGGAAACFVGGALLILRSF